VAQGHLGVINHSLQCDAAHLTRGYPDARAVDIRGSIIDETVTFANNLIDAGGRTCVRWGVFEDETFALRDLQRLRFRRNGFVHSLPQRDETSSCTAQEGARLTLYRELGVATKAHCQVKGDVLPSAPAPALPKPPDLYCSPQFFVYQTFSPTVTTSKYAFSPLYCLDDWRGASMAYTGPTQMGRYLANLTVAYDLFDGYDQVVFDVPGATACADFRVAADLECAVSAGACQAAYWTPNPLVDPLQGNGEVTGLPLDFEGHERTSPMTTRPTIGHDE